MVLIEHAERRSFLGTSTDAHATIDTERIAVLETRITDLEAEEERLKAAVATLEDENRWLGSILQQDERVREMRMLREKVNDLESDLATSRDLHRRAIDRNNNERLRFQERIAILNAEIATLKGDRS